MNLSTQKRLAAQVLKCSEKRIVLNQESVDEIQEAITKQDIRKLIIEGAITKKPVVGVSRVRANKRLVQRRRGRQQGMGTKKGTHNAREKRKVTWMNRVRAQRKLLEGLRDEESITRETYRDLYRKSKGGYFRSRRHINLYLDEQKLRVVSDGKK